jgi:hypothetical protein
MPAKKTAAKAPTPKRIDVWKSVDDLLSAIAQAEPKSDTERAALRLLEKAIVQAKERFNG